MTNSTYNLTSKVDGGRLHNKLQNFQHIRLYASWARMSECGECNSTQANMCKRKQANNDMWKWRPWFRNSYIHLLCLNNTTKRSEKSRTFHSFFYYFQTLWSFETNSRFLSNYGICFAFPGVSHNVSNALFVYSLRYAFLTESSLMSFFASPLRAILPVSRT